MYLSKGLLLRKTQNTIIVTHCGAEHELLGERAVIWENGHQGPRVSNQNQILHELSKSGLAETSNGSGNEAIYRILINCAICPAKKPAFPVLWSRPERRMYKWITKAGLQLTIAELVFLNQNKVKPTCRLLGEKNRQALTETTYTTETIPDGILESQMERSPERDSTINTVMGLLSKDKVFFI